MFTIIYSSNKIKNSHTSEILFTNKLFIKKLFLFCTLVKAAGTCNMKRVRTGTNPSDQTKTVYKKLWPYDDSRRQKKLQAQKNTSP